MVAARTNTCTTCGEAIQREFTAQELCECATPTRVEDTIQPTGRAPKEHEHTTQQLPTGSPPRRYKCFWKDETGLHVTHKSATLLQVIHLTNWQDEEIEQLINLRVGQRWEDALPGEHATGQSAFERIS